MDPTRFDMLTRALTQRVRETPSRRALLHALGGLLAVAAMPMSDMVAKRKKKHKKCKGGKKKCKGKCVDLPTDRANCGACGNTCNDGESCQNGSCTTECVPDCSGKECGDNGCGGSCGACDPEETCQNGACTTTCEPQCDGKECGPNGCGGACGSCPDELFCCDGQCVDINADPTNCGDCGLACASNEICLDTDCCRPLGQICTSAGQCCSPTCANIDEVKQGEACHLPSTSKRCCIDLSDPDPCVDACDCCGSRICHNNRCCIATGQQCFVDAACCSQICGSDQVCN